MCTVAVAASIDVVEIKPYSPDVCSWCRVLLSRPNAGCSFTAELALTAPAMVCLRIATVTWLSPMNVQYINRRRPITTVPPTRNNSERRKSGLSLATESLAPLCVAAHKTFQEVDPLVTLDF